MKTPRSKTRCVPFSRFDIANSPGWMSATEAFRSPKIVTGRVTRRTSVFQGKAPRVNASKMPLSKLNSPPGVKTRARRSSIYQKGGTRLITPKQTKTRRASLYVPPKQLAEPVNLFSKVWCTPCVPLQSGLEQSLPKLHVNERMNSSENKLPSSLVKATNKPELLKLPVIETAVNPNKPTVASKTPKLRARVVLGVLQEMSPPELAVEKSLSPVTDKKVPKAVKKSKCKAEVSPKELTAAPMVSSPLPRYQTRSNTLNLYQPEMLPRATDNDSLSATSQRKVLSKTPPVFARLTQSRHSKITNEHSKEALQQNISCSQRAIKTKTSKNLLHESTLIPDKLILEFKLTSQSPVLETDTSDLTASLAFASPININNGVSIQTSDKSLKNSQNQSFGNMNNITSKQLKKLSGLADLGEDSSLVTSTPVKSITGITGKSVYATPQNTCNSMLKNDEVSTLSARHFKSANRSIKKLVHTTQVETSSDKLKSATPKRIPSHKCPGIKRKHDLSESESSPILKRVHSRLIERATKSDHNIGQQCTEIDKAKLCFDVTQFSTVEGQDKSLEEKKCTTSILVSAELNQISTPSKNYGTSRVADVINVASPKCLAEDVLEDQSVSSDGNFLEGDSSVLSETFNTDSRSMRCVIL